MKYLLSFINTITITVSNKGSVNHQHIAKDFKIQVLHQSTNFGSGLAFLRRKEEFQNEMKSGWISN